MPVEIHYLSSQVRLDINVLIQFRSLFSESVPARLEGNSVTCFFQDQFALKLQLSNTIVDIF